MQLVVGKIYVDGEGNVFRAEAVPPSGIHFRMRCIKSVNRLIELGSADIFRHNGEFGSGAEDKWNIKREIEP